MEPVIVGKGLRKRYAGFAPVLRGVNIEVYPGELVAIMGPSGCGKSTMLHLLGLLHAPDEGTLTILGKDVLSLNREQTAAFRRGNLGFVMQQSNLFDHSTVFENVEFPLIYENVPSAERWPRVIRALELVRLTSRVHYPSNRLSGGEQQRVAIARAMVNNPRILMADEPTGALDQRTSGIVMENFRSLCHTSGVALVMVTHDPHMAEFCDTVYRLEEGVLVTQKHELPVIQMSDSNILAGPKCLMKTAMVSGDFLRDGGESFRADAYALHNKGVMSHIVTLSGGSLLGKEMERYSLPMPVRQLSGIRNLGIYLSMLFGSLQDKKLSPLMGSFFQKRILLSQARSLAHWAKENSIEFFYATDGFRGALAAWMASKKTGLPFAFEARSADGWTLEKKGYGEAFARLANDAKFVVCDSPAQEKRLRGLVPQELTGKISFVPGARTLMPAEEELGSAQGREKKLDVHILCAGSLEEGKGVELVLRAVLLLKQKNKEFKLVIAGSGKQEKRLKKLAKTMGFSNDEVFFAGQIPHENMPSLYLEADIFVSAGQKIQNRASDDIPTALLEAMAYYLPVVVSNLPSHTWLVEQGKSGLVFQEGKEDALADAIEILHGDYSLRKRMGEAAQQRANLLFPEKSEGLANLFKSFVPKKSGKNELVLT